MNQPSDVNDRLLATDLHVEATSRLMEALVESENRMRRRVELLADAVIETDSELTLVFVNTAWEALTGLTPTESIGRSAADVFPEDCREDLVRVLTDRTGAHQILRTRIAHREGGSAHVIVTTSPINSGGVVAVVRDISREVAYQEELARLSVVASSTSSLVVISDPAGCIEWVNAAFEQKTGYALSEILGHSPGSFLQGPGTDEQAVDRLRAAIRSWQPIREELLNYTKLGEPYWISLNLTPVVSGEGHLERFISVQDDITDRKRIERMKDEFISTVSHELRTPLTAITGALGLLSAGVAGAMSDQAGRLLDIANKNSNRLTVLINDLLDMDKLVEGGMPIESEVHRLLPLVQLAIQHNQPYADQYGVTLVVVDPSDDATVDVDSLRLMQVMSNLLSNACKFAPSGTTVEVGTRVQGESVRIAVRDSGPGVPASFRGQIFEKFSQADSSDTRAIGGSGLGLAISKELVERMGGAIGYESVEGQGATFFVDLPISTGTKP